LSLERSSTVIVNLEMFSNVHILPLGSDNMSPVIRIYEKKQKKKTAMNINTIERNEYMSRNQFI